MNLYAIGDIHGCLTALKKMIVKIEEDMAKNDDNTKIVFVGDYVDRGPDSAGVIEYLESLNFGDRAVELVFLRGNHEDFFLEELQSGYAPYWNQNGGAETKASYYAKGWDVSRHHTFLKMTELYHKHGPYLFVHANVDPNLKLENQNPKTMIWGRMFDGYKGTFDAADFVIRGHTPVNNIVVHPHQMLIDTGCVFGGKLSCVKCPENPLKDDFIIFETTEDGKTGWE